MGVLNAGKETAPFAQHETTIEVITKAKKVVDCSFCDTSVNRRSLVPGDDDAGCKAGAARVCRARKEFRCERICFLIGTRGRALRGERRWRQAFTEKFCPVGKFISHATPVEQHKDGKDRQMRVTGDATMFTKVGVPVGENARVTMTNVSASLKHMPHDVQMRVMSEKYESDDLDLKKCCFPGCVLPLHAADGSHFPWYFDSVKGATGVVTQDKGLTLQETASMQATFLF